MIKLYGVGPVDITNTSPTSFTTLSNFLFYYMSHFTHDIWQVEGDEHYLKMSSTFLIQFWSEGVLKLFEQKYDLPIEWNTKVFVEQPWLNWVCLRLILKPCVFNRTSKQIN